MEYSRCRTQWKTILEDVTDTTADTFLGLGLQCAKCHNHKFDPLLQKDYFRLQAFFAPLMPRDVLLADEQQLAEYRQRMSAWEAKTDELRASIAAIEKPYRDKVRKLAIDRFPQDLQAIARTPADRQTPLEVQLTYLVQRQVQAEYDRLESHLSSADKERLVVLKRELKAFEGDKPQELPIAMAVSDVSATAPDTWLPKRAPELVQPGVPSILDAEPMPIAGGHSGMTTGRRAELARWLTDASNPLTSRVMANRIWQSHFGRGLAANPSDFGVLGGPPSHPELLDWLATQLIADGWSLKSLHRKILLSATYQQSTQHPRFEEYSQIDPANEFYWRRDTLRMSAEQIRDSLLSVSGGLKDCAGGPGQLGDAPVRTIYTRFMRNSPDPLLDSFDLPQFFSSNSTRNTTTTPVQALLMFNSDILLGHARKLAAWLESESEEISQQVGLAWERVYGRQPSDQELRQSVEFILSQQSAAQQAVVEQSPLIATAKLPYRDGQALKFDLEQESPRLRVPHTQTMHLNEFTIEVFFQARSIAKTGAVRTLVSKWNGNYQQPGWRLWCHRRRLATEAADTGPADDCPIVEWQDSRSSHFFGPAYSTQYTLLCCGQLPRTQFGPAC